MFVNPVDSGRLEFCVKGQIVRGERHSHAIVWWLKQGPTFEAVGLSSIFIIPGNQSKENQDGHEKGLYSSPALVPGCSLLGRGEIILFYKERQPLSGAALELKMMMLPRFPVLGPSWEEVSRRLLNYHGWAASVMKTTRERPSGSWL